MNVPKPALSLRGFESLLPVETGEESAAQECGAPAPRVLRFSIDLPPRLLSPNGIGKSKHFSKRFKAVAAYRSAGMAACLKAMTDAKWERVAKGATRKVRISATWFEGWSPFEQGTRMSLFYRPTDEQNAWIALKAALDGFVDARLVPDDTAKHVKLGDCELKVKPADHGGRCGIDIEIEEVSA